MKYLYILIIIIIAPFYASSQQTIIDEADINTTTSLISEYLSPLGKSIGTGLNCGWWNTAKTHKILGFDLSLSLNSVEIPNTDLYFNHHETIINNNNFTSDLTTNSTPTILGNTNNATIIYKGSFSTNIEMPEGLNINNMFVPTLNLGIGIIKNTDVVVRYMPELKFKKYVKMQVFGGGIKHDILQYIPFAKKLPIDLSIMSTYTNLSMKTNLPGLSDININCTAISNNLIFSKKISLITLFGGIGHNYTCSNLDIDSNVTLGNTISIQQNNIIETDFGKMHDAKLNIGARIQIMLININANYNYSLKGYNTISLGLSANLR